MADVDRGAEVELDELVPAGQPQVTERDHEVRPAGIVHDDIKRAKLVKRRLDCSAGGGCIGNVERYGTDLIPVTLYQVSKLNWIPRGGN